MAEYDLTRVIGQYLDRHMVFPLLEFLSDVDQPIYPEEEILKGKLDLLSVTNMVDFAMDVHDHLYGQASEHLTERRSMVVRKLEEINKRTEPIVTIIQDPVAVQHIQNSRDGRRLFETLSTEFGFQRDMLNVMYENAKFQFECGNYSGASEYLYFVRVLSHADDKNALNALWGKLASEILLQNWDAALEDLNQLKEVIDSAPFSPRHQLESLQQRTWLIHWSLFIFFNHPKGRDLIIDMFLYDNKYLNAIQTTCPHILRYLTTAIITNKRRKNVLKDLVRVIQQEAYTYRDPITEFLECLYVNFDFDKAQVKLQQCAEVLKNDFFLVACKDDFIENARLFIFETFCQIHQCISISMLAEKLNMSREEAEKWIVNMIRNARLDAKIDSQLGHVIMGAQAISPYQQLIEKTKAIHFRSNQLSVALESKLTGNRPGESWAGHEM